MKNDMSRQVLWGVGIALMLSLAMHLPFLNLPPYSQHVWRQTSTLNVADNFYEESMNIFLPRVNQRYDGDGITGAPFPLYEWVLASSYHIFGNQFWLHRSLSWLLTVMGAFAMFTLAKRWWKIEMAALAAFVFYLFSPELFYDGWIALPDTMALAFCLWGLIHFERFWNDGKQNSIWISGVFFMLGGAVKLQYLGIGFIPLGMLIRDRNKLNLLVMLQLALFGGLAVLPALAWYRYSAGLIEKSGLADFGLELKPADSLEMALNVVQKNLISDIPEVILGFVAFAGFLLCFFLFLRNPDRFKHPLFLPILVFSLGFLVYHLLELRVLELHQYYMLPYLTILIPLAAKGITSLSRGKWSLLVVFLLLQITITGFRMIPSRFAGEDKMIHPAFWDEDSREALRNCIPDSSLVLTGPDDSRCINFYFLHKKGWAYGSVEELFVQHDDGTNMDDAMRGNCEYLMTSDTHIEQSLLAPYLKEQVYYNNGISVYRLRPPEE